MWTLIVVSILPLVVLFKKCYGIHMRNYTVTGLNGRWTAGSLRIDLTNGMSIRSLSAKYCKSRSRIKYILSQPDDYVFHSSSFLASCVSLVTMAQTNKPQDVPEVLIVHSRKLVKRMKDRDGDETCKVLLGLLKETEFAGILEVN